MKESDSRDLGVLLLIAGVAIDELLTGAPEWLVAIVLLAAALIYIAPLARQVWQALLALLERKLHPPIVRFVDTATLAVRPQPLSTHPFGRSTSFARIEVYVMDQLGNRLDGAKVRFQTNNGLLRGNSAIPSVGRSIVAHTDSDTQSDKDFLTYNPNQAEAGTVEVTLDCSAGAGAIPGTTALTITVERPGADIVLISNVQVVGPPSGFTLDFQPPDKVSKGEVVSIVATVHDANNVPVADGTPVFFAVNGGRLVGQLDAQGGRPTVGGRAVMLWLTDQECEGEFRVVALTGGVDNLGQPVGEWQYVKPYQTF